MEILEIEKGYKLENGAEATSVFATVGKLSRITKRKPAQITLAIPDDWAGEMMQHSLSVRNTRFKKSEHNYLLIRIPITEQDKEQKSLLYDRIDTALEDLDEMKQEGEK